ncbi:hypothetical protein PInf_027557 [Phytophthora infestans]|nr:hypothetical protein PInf_027557 [Phytophthora infestans]
MPSARNSVEEALDLGDDYVKSIGSDEAAIASADIIPDGGNTGDDEEQDSESSLNYGIDSDEEDALSMNTIGQHTGAVVNLRTRGISPVIKPEIDALLKVGMSAGRVRNMMMFKYLRDPSMAALIPETKTMENRKAHLKKKAEEGWKNDQIQAARSALRCTCKNYMHTGWICAHVIASLDLLEKI